MKINKTRERGTLEDAMDPRCECLGVTVRARDQKRSLTEEKVLQNIVEWFEVEAARGS